MNITNNVVKDSTDEELPANALEESSVTMLDILEEEKELEEEYAAVLGASDEKCCTFVLGPVKRQALYSCLTCCPNARNSIENCAGVCLACSFQCHEKHELVELYTKRNFRCDCPTERTGKNHCTLNGSLRQPEKANINNLYNQNFQGLYCSCHRPYPDPERKSDELMLQCVICEDWFHLQHLNSPVDAEKLVEACSEMICDSCMDRHKILQSYIGLALKKVECSGEPANSNKNIIGSVTVCEDNDDNKLKNDLDKSISEIMNMSESTGAETTGDEPPAKRQKLNENDVKENCRKPDQKGIYEKGPTFWTSDWRQSLCQCSSCMSVYEAEKIEFLLDSEDSAQIYEERGIKKHGNESSYEQGIRALASIDRVQQIDVITEYNRMKDKLKEYLQKFAASKKVVTEEDINTFFAEMRNEKSGDIGLPYTCR